MLFEATDPRRVVVSRCRKRYKRAKSKRTPKRFWNDLMHIYQDITESASIDSSEQAWFNVPTLSSEQAWSIAEGTWSLSIRLMSPNMATVFSHLPVTYPENFENMSDDDRVLNLAALVFWTTQLELDAMPLEICARIPGMGIRIATDALLASSPELFYKEVEQ